MIKRTLSNGVKVLKVSTWLSAIFSVLLILIVGFFTVFPSFLKAPIESELSEITGLEAQLSAVSFELDWEGVTLNVDELTFNDQISKQNFAKIQGLHWRVQLARFFEDVYRPNRVDIDTLTLNTNQQTDSADFSLEGLKRSLSLETLEMASFFESLSIGKTFIQGEQTFEIASLDIGRDEQQLLMRIADQEINQQLFDLTLALSVEQLDRDGFLTLPMVMKNEEFSLLSNLKIYHQNDDDYLEFSGFIEQIKATRLDEYLPAMLIGESTNQWMKRGFKSGLLQDIKLNVVKNISQDLPIKANLVAHLTDSELVFNSDWQALQNLDANISTNGKSINVLVNSTTLYDLPLKQITLAMPDMSQAQLDVSIVGKINTDSEALTAFLANAPSGSVVKDAVKQFTLKGPLTGDLDLIIPLDNRASTLDIDLSIKDNQLTTLDGAVVVENYNSTIAFHDDNITTSGEGKIRNMPFDIRINPNNRNDDKDASFAVELINNDRNFELYLTRRLDESWRARVESETLKTNIEIGLSEGLPSVRILGLQATTFDSIKGDLNIEPNDFPNMYLSAHGVFVDEQIIPNFSVKLESKDNILKISDLTLEGIGVGEQDLNFNGAWVAGKTGLIAKANGDALSEFLEKINYKEKVNGGKFDLDIRLFCDCAPWNMNLKEISGIAKMNIKQGVFTNQDPNIGRVLSLLNIKSTAKRLKLDVKDLTDKGFTYDNINAQITLQNSVAKINSFKLSSSSSDITLTGQSNISDQVYDIEAKVIPAFGDAVPAATYLAGGGLIGLGVWLVDESLFEGKLIDKIVDQVVEFKYKIIGPWDNPTIENISSIL